MRDYLQALEQDAAKDPEQRARELSKRELPKRFYKEAVPATVEGGFAIHLDGRPVKTPSRTMLVLTHHAVAQAVADEWNAQVEVINPAVMPLTRIANSAQDAVAKRFAEVSDEITRFCGTDALCYRADEPETLVARQRELWDPVLSWAEAMFGGRFVRIAGIIHQEQPEALLKAYRARLDSFTPLGLAALHTATSLAGSAVLALALSDGHLSVEEAWLAAHVEEDFNVERWGQDEQATQVRTYKRTEFDAAALILGMNDAAQV
ncbi:ATP12 family chaperone protein [Roseibium algae]|uniref:ATP12 family protein n=1 Tax=Roseibium algae TaxID=3123038 RepID=A0ABU8TRR0_9HYPH